MQTFLPLESFRDSAKVLDRQRLGKQRLEAYQILDICIKKKENPEIKLPWENHPARLMWVGYELQLYDYLYAICNEWQINRGYKDTILDKANKNLLEWCCINCKNDKPPFMGNNKFHASHRSNLLRKDPIYYSRFGWKEPNDLPYFWPIR